MLAIVQITELTAILKFNNLSSCGKSIFIKKKKTYNVKSGHSVCSRNVVSQELQFIILNEYKKVKCDICFYCTVLEIYKILYLFTCIKL